MGKYHYPPLGYESPSFPALSLHVLDHTPTKKYSLFYLRDIWRFTVIWTLILFLAFHVGAAVLAWAMHGSKSTAWKYMWAVPLLCCAVAAAQAVIAGSVVGLLLGAVYRSAYFHMSPWIPFIWGWINVLVILLSSFSIQGGM
ncbi:hypothetical protein TD95_004108 [Thielaviopsis punctulata]|uniref:Integral membrane protein n=1 Tax=Thielaviopsis punctulata TaxID=72032 RepID=A0A0F4ZK72_9PEZI|nr:hypothetical protein TD95_004108 [Thielaviopsis punctulata]